jgi:glutaredoxin
VNIMADTENAKKEGSPSASSLFEGENKVWLIGLLGLLVGLLVMYIAMPALFPVKPLATGNNTVVTGTTEAFVFNQAKAQEIGTMLSDMFYVNTGGQVPVTYVRYEEKSSHAILYYSVDGNEMPVYVSKDYAYLYPNAMDVAELKTQIAQAKEDMAALELEEEQPPAELVKTAEPSVQIFVMSYCPYGNQAENGLNDVVNLLAEEVAFEPVYIISGSAGNYQSLHGASELNEDIREKIIFNKYGEKKWMEFVYDTNANCTVKTIDTCWKESANRTGVDIAAVEAEYNTSFNAIADAEVAKVDAAGVSGSPTIIMNGATYSGGRTPESYKSWICTGFLDSPADCTQSLNSTAAAAAGSC